MCFLFHRRSQIPWQSQQAWLYDFRRSPDDYKQLPVSYPPSFPFHKQTCPRQDGVETDYVQSLILLV